MKTELHGLAAAAVALLASGPQVMSIRRVSRHPQVADHKGFQRLQVGYGILSANSVSQIGI